MSAFSPFELGIFREASHVVVMQAFFDASENDGFLAVAGYLFRKKHIKEFERRWRAMLRKHGLDHFHMTDCNAGADQFKDMSKDERIECQTMAVSLICEFATVGVMNSVSISDFQAVMDGRGYMSNPFSLCAHGALMMCKSWADENDPIARIAYIFDAGDAFMGDANNILTSIAEDTTRRSFFHYETHAFVPMRSSIPTQAADILAWHECKQHGRTARGESRLRTDFAVLLDGVKTMRYIHTRSDIESVIDIAKKHVPFEKGLI